MVIENPDMNNDIKFKSIKFSKQNTEQQGRAGGLANPATTQVQNQVWVQHLPHQWSAGTRERASPADPKLQNLHDIGQQQDIQ